MEPYHIPQEKVAVHEVVGGGALGSVYRGVVDGREVALKCIHLLRDDAPAIRAMGGRLRPDERRHVLDTFRRECDLLRQLQHENILPFIGVVVDAAQQPLYLAATYVGTGNLHELIHGDSGLGLRTGDGGTLSLALQTKVAVGVFSALAYLASVPAIHRDVKPANILTVLSRSGLERVYLADFGEAQQLTRNMAVEHGTPHCHALPCHSFARTSLKRPCAEQAPARRSTCPLRCAARTRSGARRPMSSALGWSLWR